MSVKKRNRIPYFLSYPTLLPCHIPTFLCTHSTCLSALSTFLRFALLMTVTFLRFALNDSYIPPFCCFRVAA